MAKEFKLFSGDLESGITKRFELAENKYPCDTHTWHSTGFAVEKDGEYLYEFENEDGRFCYRS